MLLAIPPSSPSPRAWQPTLHITTHLLPQPLLCLHSSRVTCIAFTPQGMQCCHIVAGYEDGQMRAWDVSFVMASATGATSWTSEGGSGAGSGSGSGAGAGAGAGLKASGMMGGVFLKGHKGKGGEGSRSRENSETKGVSALVVVKGVRHSVPLAVLGDVQGNILLWTYQVLYTMHSVELRHSIV